MKISNVTISLPRVYVSPFLISYCHGGIRVRISKFSRCWDPSAVAPISNKMILDVEFVDDIPLYMHAKEGNLCKAQAALETFCMAFGAKVN